MLRHRVRRAASQITLDFLLPVTARHPRTLLFAYQRRSSSNKIVTAPHITPELQSILSNLPPVNADITSVRASDASFYNTTLPQLSNALSKRDLEKASKLWHPLQDRQLTRLLGPAQWENYSRHLTTVIRDRNRSDVFTSEEREVVEQIAVSAAARGYTGALRACMVHLLRRGDLDAVYVLYAQYLDALPSNGGPSVGKDTEGSASVEVEEDEEDVSEVSNQSHDTDFEASIYRTQPVFLEASSIPVVRREILVCVLAAYAMQDNFRAGLDAVLDSGVRITRGILTDLFHELHLKAPMRSKLERYISRLDIARLLARNFSLAFQLNNLTRDHSDRSLERIYKGIITELSDPDPWVTTDPTKVTKHRPVLMPEFAWASFLKGFLVCKRLDLAEQLWEDMGKFGVKAPISVWTALIDGYGALRMPDQAAIAWKSMLDYGIKPDALAFRAVIQGMFVSGHPDRALKRYQEFEQHLPRIRKEEPESTILIVYNTVLHGLLFHQDVDAAKQVLEDMQKRGPKPDIVSFNTFMRYYGRKSEMRAFAEVLKMVDAANLSGDEFTFSTLLTTLLKVRKDATEIMFGLMRKQGIQPNVTMYTSIIGHQVKQPTVKDLQAALEILEKMEHDESEAVRPNEITYTTFLTGILRATWMDSAVAEEWIKDITEKMKTRNITPKRPTYHILIRASLDNPESRGIQNALYYYRDMVQSKVTPGQGTWYILLSGLIARGEWALANELLGDMAKIPSFTPGGALTTLIQRVRRSPVSSRRRERTTPI
ncbi:hypothetical protein NLI96_g974 [Meripilus lineatus]|uniref:Mitochondrial group I intron splicing factor CCM1 n=1 Tax=Meripilus lineatus TaxID=2056292 RepID=A0AAD5YLG6_9APHY|nr:hypothetical protein NLI96_g974 [Physisporinus lineatus]